MNTKHLIEMLASLEHGDRLRLKLPPIKLAYDEEVGGYVDKQQKDIGSIEWKNPEINSWEHLISIPVGQIYKYKHPEYKAKYINSMHNSLLDVYQKLRAQRLIHSSERGKIVY